MPNLKITDLTTAGPLSGTELVELVQGGVNKKATVQSITGSNISTDGTFASPSDTQVPSTQAVKTLFDTLSGGGGPAIAANYDDTADLIANQGTQEENALYYVADASDDTTVDSGWAVYRYLGTTNGDLTDYQKLSEEESLDAVFNVLGTALTGYSASAGTISATDTILQAFNKIGYFIANINTTIDGWWTSIKTQSQTFTARLIGKHTASGFGTLSDASTIAWNADSIGNFAQVTLGGNRTLAAITNPLTGALYTLRVIQDGTGGRTLAFNAAYTFPGSIAPYINLAGSAVTVLQFFYDGTAFRYVLPSSGYRLGDLFLEQQKATGSNQRPLWIDSTGKVQSSQFMNIDEINKLLELIGKSTLDADYLQVWRDSDLNLVARLSNGGFLELGGTAHIISVNDGIPSSSAGIEINANQQEAYFIKDKSSTRYIKIRTTTGNECVILNEAVEYDFKKGFIVRKIQFSGTVTATNNGQTTLFTVPVDNNQLCLSELELFTAYAPDGTSVCTGSRHFARMRKDGTGTITSTISAPTMDRDPAGGAAALTFFTSTDGLNVRFTNDATGKAYRYEGQMIYKVSNLPGI